MDAGLLDTLVKLASIGASGICIFAIFWIGWLVKGTRKDASAEEHKTIRFYMTTCIFISLVAAGSGVANAMINANINAQLQAENQTISNENEELVTQTTVLATEVAEVKADYSALEQNFSSVQAEHAVLETQYGELTERLRVDPNDLAQQYLTNPEFRRRFENRL